MSNPYTETTNTRLWQEGGWELVPYNTAVLVVSPPQAFLDLVPSDTQSLLISDRVVFEPLSDIHSIDQHTHEGLTERSLREFEDIWRTLADM